VKSRRWILALDVGGTNMTAGLFHDEVGEPLVLRSRSTPVAEGVGAVVARGVALLDEVRKEAEGAGVPPDRIVGAGIGVPGAVDPTRGIVSRAPNLAWNDVPIRDRFQEALGLPVVVDNDANCAALGEWWAGAGRGSRLMVGATLGTGIGGGIVREGRVLRGVTGSAGEIGHMTIQLDGRSCSCGNRGCLEAYASGTAIAQRAREALEEQRIRHREGGDPNRAGRPDDVDSPLPDHVGSTLSEDAGSILDSMVDGRWEELTAAHVSRAAGAGDELARAIMAETARYLGAGLAGLVNVLNPDRIVLTGGVALAGDLLLEPVRRHVRRQAFPSAAEACVIALARSPEGAGVRGAALTFRREVLEGHR
jgi:glucokinase